MAGKSVKRQVSANQRILNRLLGTVGVLNALFVVSHYLQRPGSWKLFLLTLVPELACVLVLEKTGRPSVVNGKIVRHGQDLEMSGGLVEYLFDIVYFTMGIHLLSVVFGSFRVYWLYLAIPGFAGYKLYALYRYFRPGRAPGAAQQQQAQPEKSKRQLKREKRAGK